MPLRRTLLSFSAVAALACTAVVTAAPAASLWTDTWTAAVSHVNGPNNEPNAPAFTGQTTRQYVFTSIGGSLARLHFSNEYGTTPLVLGRTRVGYPDASGSIIAGSDRAVTFGGRTAITTPPGGTAVSDPVFIQVPTLGYLAVSTYYPSALPTNDLTIHVFSSQNNQLGAGDQTAGATMTAPTWNQQYFFLTGVDVGDSFAEGALVTIGASFTDGFESPADQNRRWPNLLAQRLAKAGRPVGVLNQGLAGADLIDDTNFYGPSTVTRFDRDVLDQAGVRWAVIGEFNDLGDGNSPTLIGALSDLIARAHAQRIAAICATFPPVYANGGVEATRQHYNAFVRSPTSGCDGVFDEDAILRDATDPTLPQPAFRRPVPPNGVIDTHPTDAGYAALAEGFDLDLLRSPAPAGWRHSAQPAVQP